VRLDRSILDLMPSCREPAEDHTTLGRGEGDAGLVAPRRIAASWAADRKLIEVMIEVSGGVLKPSGPMPLFPAHIIAPRFTISRYDVMPGGGRFV
jgi:hypothetical protein